MEVEIALVRRGRTRIPALRIKNKAGGYLLRPVPTSAHEVARAAYEAEVDTHLGVEAGPAARQVTVVHRDTGRTMVYGGTAERRNYDWSRTQDEHVRQCIAECRSHRNNGWKTHRRHQYR